MIKLNHSVGFFLFQMRNILSISIFEKTISHKILSNYPYNEIVDFIGTDYDHLDKLLSPIQILDFFNE